MSSIENKKDTISEILGVDYLPTVVQAKQETAIVQPEKPKDTQEKTDFEKDYEKVRDNLFDLIEEAKKASKGILDVASQTDHPRAYEVASQLLQTAMLANEKLMDLHKKVLDTKKENPEASSQPKTVNNNAFFIGSSHELMKMIKEMKSEKVQDLKVVEEKQDENIIDVEIKDGEERK